MRSEPRRRYCIDIPTDGAVDILLATSMLYAAEIKSVVINIWYAILGGVLYELKFIQ